LRRPIPTFQGRTKMPGITLRRWFRHYNTEPAHFTPEDIAWMVIDKTGWPPTPLLMMWLVRRLEDLELDRVKNHFESEKSE
jgi:hypothetical protein